MMKKICSICGIEKPISEFHKSGYKDSLRGDCKECRHIQTIKDRSKTKARDLKANYGISLDEYSQMLEAQDNQCAICGTLYSVNTKTFHVDHCHKTRKVRGLLCSKCNRGIGLLQDDPTILSKAIDYLRA